MLRNGASYIADENVNDEAALETSLAVPTNDRHCMLHKMLPSDPVIPALSMEPKEIQACRHTKTCTQMLTAAFKVK